MKAIYKRWQSRKLEGDRALRFCGGFTEQLTLPPDCFVLWILLDPATVDGVFTCSLMQPLTGDGPACPQKLLSHSNSGHSAPPL